MTTIEEAALYYEKIMNGTATEDDITTYKLIRSTSWLDHNFFDMCAKELVMSKYKTNEMNNQ